MMGRRKGGQGQFFYAFDLDEVVPPDHLVRQIDAVLDLNWVHKERPATSAARTGTVLARLYDRAGRGPMTPKAFHALFGRIGERAKMPFPVHPHMLRHGCGYALANAGHDTRALQAWLGHKNIQHTVRYTELAPGRFKDFWRD
jgi:site-specific recombinase XerD